MIGQAALASGAALLLRDAVHAAPPAADSPDPPRLRPVAAAESVPPALALADLDGRNHALADYRGRIVLVNFWATWCPPCVIEMPSLQLLRDRIGAEPLAILGVNYGENPPRVREFVARMDLDFPVLLDAFHLARRDWKVRSLPTTWIVDRGGRLRYRVDGEIDWIGAEAVGKVKALAGAAAV
ncbi:MAG: TlpA family protein disulfide reductase [Lautropia sp.]